MIEIWIHLFGKPEWEMNLEKAKAEDFEKLGNELQQRLGRISEVVAKLEKAQWDRSVGLYDIRYYKGISMQEARKELADLEISEEEFSLEEFENEW